MEKLTYAIEVYLSENRSVKNCYIEPQGEAIGILINKSCNSWNKDYHSTLHVVSRMTCQKYHGRKCDWRKTPVTGSDRKRLFSSNGRMYSKVSFTWKQYMFNPSSVYSGVIDLLGATPGLLLTTANTSFATISPWHRRCPLGKLHSLSHRR